MQVMDVEAGIRPASFFYSRLVEGKLASGQYATEAVPCFCGASDAAPIVTRDRYGIPYQMGLCMRCGLLYASPRMTADAYRQFYAHEYRKIYDEPWLTQDDIFALGVEDGRTLKEWLAFWNVKPKSVLDLGCNMGAMLKPFQDTGCLVAGVDYDPSAIAYGQSRDMPVGNGSWTAITERFDLVMMHHVFEHCLDLGETLRQVRSLMRPSGYLYLGVPGLREWDLNRLWQNAHTYQFCYDTLTYVMECHGFEAVYCDERIASLWQYTGIARDKADVPPRAVHENAHHLIGWLEKHEKRAVPEIKTYCKFSPTEREANRQAALEVGIPDIRALENKEQGREAIIICGGPSVDGQIRTLRKLKAHGHAIVAIERMYAWCLAHDLPPDYVVVLDASDDVYDSLECLRTGTIHLVSDQCQRPVFERVKDSGYLFHMPGINGDLAKDIMDRYHRDQVTVLHGGGSVSLAAMTLSCFLGMTKLHIFGFDCHLTHGNYAHGITGVGTISGSFELEIEGEVFVTTTPYLAFAQQFFHFWSMADASGVLTGVQVYGPSLVAALSKENIRGE